MRSVEIEFVSEQQYHDDRESSKLKAKGIMQETNGLKVISYTEPDEEMGKCETIVKIINNNFVEMSRKGVYETTFLIEEGKTHSCIYRTPFGEMSMDIVAERVNAQIPDCSGKILLCYRLESNGEIIGENNLLMKINEV
ncbi:MAG: DUF1934 domain-containing protein [Ruminococcaceae bacterium]|nr:DUF1934 domain-containing protein [Oscillospiraceae bacterium]